MEKHAIQMEKFNLQRIGLKNKFNFISAFLHSFKEKCIMYQGENVSHKLAVRHVSVYDIEKRFSWQ